MTTMTSAAGFRPKLWAPGDWNAFFGFGTNILVNMLMLTDPVAVRAQDAGLDRVWPHPSGGRPDDVPVDVLLCVSGLRLAKRTGRNDVCALPSGISVPHMFIVTFVIMLPIALKTNDPIKGWEAGLTWVFFQSFILMIGGFIAPIVRKITPRAALLGTLAGVSITFISMAPAHRNVHDAGDRPDLLRHHLGELVRRL